MSVLAEVLQFSWVVYRGVDFIGPIITLQGEDAEGLPVPAPEVLTSTGEIHFREDVEDSTILLTLSSANGALIIDGAAATIDITVPASMLTDLTLAENAVGDLRMTWSDGTQEIIACINADFRLPVTRS